VLRNLFKMSIVYQGQGSMGKVVGKLCMQDIEQSIDFWIL
jgi:hypothetical protein